jgi:hypothetical protein
MPRLTSISISGSKEIIEGSNAEYRCTAKYSDGSTRDVTARTRWSENSNYANFTGRGSLETMDVPTDTSFEITARYRRRSAEEAVTIVPIENQTSQSPPSPPPTPPHPPKTDVDSRAAQT